MWEPEPVSLTLNLQYQDPAGHPIPACRCGKVHGRSGEILDGEVWQL